MNPARQSTTKGSLMAKVTVYGASDDLIEVEGDISEEFNPPYDPTTGILAFSEGTVLRVEFTQDGIWRVTPLFRGTATISIVQAVDEDDDNYSDRVTLEGDVRWVVFGSEFRKAS